MKRYFLVTNEQNNLGVFEYASNEEADSVIMQMVWEHYCADDCELDKGFKIEEYQYRPLHFTGSYIDEDGGSNNFDLYIEQVAFYSKKE